MLIITDARTDGERQNHINLAHSSYSDYKFHSKMKRLLHLINWLLFPTNYNETGFQDSKQDAEPT